MAHDSDYRIRNVTAVLGPTNTGKTHLAIERMLGHETGMIGLPLRLLAREVYDRIKTRVGADKVALITGEEKIKPEGARYWVATVEAMPPDITVDFLAIDEIQLAADPERGHVFTDRLLNARGRSETLLLGAQTMREAISDLIKGANFISRPRLSKLTYAGEKKLTRLPARTAIVAFSAAEVYSLAEVIRRQRGGTAVVIGALSPRTRNAQVELYQSGDVDIMVATDAIGMGLNLDVDHVAFAGTRKFDGVNHRNLTPGELAQIAGRAGRHMNDGTFGVTGSVDPLDPDLVERLETHNFDSIRTLQWRSRDLDFTSVESLRESLREFPGQARLARARSADDVIVLENVLRDPEVARLAHGKAAVARLWDACQVPDYRKVSENTHAEIVGDIYKFISSGNGLIPEDWFGRHVAFSDRTDGDIDTLSNRLAHVRTWTFVANRPDWLADPGQWQGRTREIEDNLSDALHERLTQRFVDRRTSALIKGMRDKEELTAEIAPDGSISVENHFVGKLSGFRFTMDTSAEGADSKATRSAAAQVLARELAMKARRVVAANADAFKVTRTGRVLWRDEDIARIDAGDDVLNPSVTVDADDHLSVADREKVQARLDTWIKEHIAERLKPLVDLQSAEDITGLARGIAFQLRENLGVLKRESVAHEITALDQAARAQLRKYGVRFGAFNIYLPPLLKPAPAELAACLWLIKHGARQDGGATPPLPRAGLTSTLADPSVPEALYRAYGFHVCGPRAVRLDIIERLADIIRPLVAWRPGADAAAASTTPPKGATGDGGFKATDQMMSILGCSAAELGNVLKELGFRSEQRAIVATAVVSTAETTPASDGSEAPTIVPEAEAAATPPVTDASAVSETGETAAPAVETAPAAAEPAATTEPVFETIWRPRRPNRNEPRGHRGERQDHRPQRHRPRPAETTATAAAASGEAGGTGDSAATAAGAETPSGPGHRRHDRHHKRGDGQHQSRRDGGQRGNQQGRPDRGGDGARHGRDRDKGRESRDRRDDPVAQRPSTSATQRRQQFDPDSPFAALSALRDAMSKRNSEPTSR